MKRLFGIYLTVLFLVILFNSCYAQESSTPWITEIKAPQYFAVLVKDVDKAVEWYSIVFGLNKLGGSKAQDGAWRIENLRNDRLYVEVIRDNRAKDVSRALGFRKVGFYVPDVRTVAERINSLTGELPKVLDFPKFEVRIIQIRDPEGNLIQLFSPLEKDNK